MLKLTLIEWFDHYASSEWSELPLNKKPMQFCTVGWIVEEDDLYVHVAATKGVENHLVGGVESILKSCISSRSEVTAATQSFFV